jgi:ABC-type transporter Mla MlaB component
MVQDATDTDSSFSVHQARAQLVLVGDVGQEMADSLKGQASVQMPNRLDELVVDLRACRFLEPAAVDMLSSVLGQADAAGARINLEGMSANLRVILGIAGLLDLAESSGPAGD